MSAAHDDCFKLTKHVYTTSNTAMCFHFIPYLKRPEIRSSSSLVIHHRKHKSPNFVLSAFLSSLFYSATVGRLHIPSANHMKPKASL